MAGPSIDVGLSGDMTTLHAAGFTVVTKGNPANATGLITGCNIWANGLCSNVEIAAFTAAGNSLTTRGYASLANLAAGDNAFLAQNGDFTPFEIRAGDYIGAYCTATFGLGIDANGTGGADIWKLGGDYIPRPGGDTFVVGSGQEVSVYAEGYELGSINIGDVWKTKQNILINIGDAWKQITVGSLENISDVWKNIVH